LKKRLPDSAGKVKLEFQRGFQQSAKHRYEIQQMAEQAKGVLETSRKRILICMKLSP
jgi:hypothetical protein